MVVAAPSLLPGDAGRLAALGLLGVAILVTILAIVLVPDSWRPRGRVVPVVAVAAAYIAHRVGVETGLSPWLDHDVLEPIGAQLDEISYWFVAFLGALAVLLVAHLRDHRRRSDNATR